MNKILATLALSAVIASPALAQDAKTAQPMQPAVKADVKPVITPSATTATTPAAKATTEPAKLGGALPAVTAPVAPIATPAAAPAAAAPVMKPVDAAKPIAAPAASVPAVAPAAKPVEAPKADAGKVVTPSATPVAAPAVMPKVEAPKVDASKTVARRRCPGCESRREEDRRSGQEVTPARLRVGNRSATKKRPRQRKLSGHFVIATASCANQRQMAVAATQVPLLSR